MTNQKRKKKLHVLVYIKKAKTESGEQSTHARLNKNAVPVAPVNR